MAGMGGTGRLVWASDQLGGSNLRRRPGVGPVSVLLRYAPGEEGGRRGPVQLEALLGAVEAAVHPAPTAPLLSRDRAPPVNGEGKVLWDSCVGVLVLMRWCWCVGVLVYWCWCVLVWVLLVLWGSCVGIAGLDALPPPTLGNDVHVLKPQKVHKKCTLCRTATNRSCSTTPKVHYW